jgi:hypothetical protein
VVSRHVDARVVLVPRREFVVNVGFYGSQIASHKVDNTRDLVFAIWRQLTLAGINYRLGMASLTSVYQKNLHPKVCVADAKQDNFVGFVKLEKVVPEIANQRLYLLLYLFLIKLGSECVNVLYSALD